MNNTNATIVTAQWPQWRCRSQFRFSSTNLKNYKQISKHRKRYLNFYVVDRLHLNQHGEIRPKKTLREIHQHHLLTGLWLLFCPSWINFLKKSKKWNLLSEQHFSVQKSDKTPFLVFIIFGVEHSSSQRRLINGIRSKTAWAIIVYNLSK